MLALSGKSDKYPFGSARGLRVHTRRAHGLQYHQEAERISNQRATTNWVEKEKLAKAEAELIVKGEFNVRTANIMLEGSVGLRTIQAIKARRRRPDHRERVEGWIERLQANNDPGGIEPNNEAQGILEPGSSASCELLGN